MSHDWPTQLNIALKPVTPIHVWSGSTATINIDAFIDGRYLYVLTQDEMLKYMNKIMGKISKYAGENTTAPECRDLVLNILSGKDISYSNSSSIIAELLKCMIKERYIKPIAEQKIKGQIPSSGKIKLLHPGFIPGSTLKGYIRTAMLRELLSKLRPSDITRIIKSNIDLRREPKRVSLGLEAALLERPRFEEQGGLFDLLQLIKVSDPEFTDLKLALRELRVVYKYNINRKVARIPAVVIEPFTQQSPNLIKYNIILDTMDRIAERIVVRSELGIDEKKHENIKESIDEIIRFREEFARRLEDSKFLWSALRNFGCHLVEREIEKIRMVRDELKYYSDVLLKLRDLCREGGRDCIPARIGFMTGHEAKTVIDLVERYDKETYKKVVDLMSMTVRRNWDSLTLKLVDLDGKLVGVGWCLLCRE